MGWLSKRRATLKNLERRVYELESDVTALEGDFGEFDVELESHSTKLEGLRSDHDELEAKVDGLSDDITDIERKFD